ncbi:MULTISPECIES: pseudaminic acid cytidylyltransferase [Helicobacter]|uniref:Pseudaminic acid cytidylyltransferase n=1 Tax=Helicobacter ibis TaxID=2962633 RepID=A0ABT4VF19_9HELI|nr:MULTISPECIES: pseudaminic acid cytidylyltransferase [Helicobacter]MDA3967178.1 pseudaminic acid cytidylyltransferase [Helicobacter sp. WB40]MDA3969305.1 pseudaminic acid cytidylyltransferase [Helicobacter ibis]
MCSKKINSICIIPARGGSKRIPKKNIKDFLGKPIIAYSIDNAIKSGIFDAVYVSSDDDEILEVGLKFGATPLKRDSKLSDDYTGTREVIEDAINKLSFSGIACCLYATAPLLKSEKLKEAFNVVDDNYVLSVVEYSYSPLRSFMIQNGKNEMLFKDRFNMRSQDLNSIYHDAGQFYFAKSSTWITKHNIFEDSKSIILDELEVQDIDTLNDWKLAEMKYSLLYR